MIRLRYRCAPVLVLVFMLAGCKDSGPPRGDYFIPREDLVEILVDMHMTDAFQNSPEFRQLREEYDSIDMYSDIFRKYGTTRKAFDSTMVYYSSHPKKLTDVYDEVIMKMTMINDSLRE